MIYATGFETDAMHSLQILIDLVAQYQEAILTVCYLLLSLATTFHAVIFKRDTRAAIGWIGLAWLSPFIGSAVYFLFGVNRIQRRGTRLAVHDAWDSAGAYPPPPTDQEEAKWQELAGSNPGLAAMRVLSGRLTQRELTPGNDIHVLINGEESFPAMLSAIDNAQYSVALLSYIFDSDHAGDAFLDALHRAQLRGVQVRVLIDGVGARYSRPSMITLLRRAGVPCATFNPTQLPRLPTYSNLRNHRKILVVDGQIGFTGGTNIRASHRLDWEQKDYAQCLHFSLQGPVVASLQRTFTIDWAFTTGEILSGEHWFPNTQKLGKVWARGVLHGPDEDFERLSDLLVGAVAVARENIRIATPYFLPTPALTQALGVAALRGVQVDILIPMSNNIRIVQWATMAQLWQLTNKQCNVYFTAPPFDHTKLMIMDRAWSLIGSTNWDPRSLRLNFEFNVECYDETLAGELIEIFEEKRSSAELVTQEQLAARPGYERLRDGFASLASPYL